MKKWLIFSLLLLLPLLFVACGDDDNDLPPPERDVVEVASDFDNLNTLMTALEAANLTETLSGEGPYTVFAPTDEAFDALPEGVLDGLLADPEGDLSQILLYHVVSGRLSADEVSAADSLTTLQGEAISIEIVDDEVILNGQVRIVTSNIQANNGVIHIIDGVLMPPSMDDVVPLPTVAEIVETREDLSTLAAALTAANLLEDLGEEGPYTLFAPTDEAFNLLDEGTLADLLADPEGDLNAILQYHVVSGLLEAEDIVALESVTTFQGQDLTIEVVDGAVILNDSIQVTVTDIEASNGVIHLIDAVLIPSS